MGTKAKLPKIKSCLVGSAVCVGLALVCLGYLQPSRLGHYRYSSRQKSNSTFSKAGVIVCSCSEGNLALRLCAEFKKLGALWGNRKSQALSFVGSNWDAFPGKGISRERLVWRWVCRGANSWDFFYQGVILWGVTGKWERAQKVHCHFLHSMSQAWRTWQSWKGRQV